MLNSFCGVGTEKRDYSYSELFKRKSYVNGKILLSWVHSISMQKPEPPRGVPRKRSSENMQQV